MNKIVIAGGGSAGWMSALYLSKLTAHFENPIAIEVIEPKDIPVIGVGEATVPSIKNFFQQLGIPETDLFIRADASIKTSIKFKNWLENSGEYYYHPFDNLSFSDGFDITEHWLNVYRHERPEVHKFAIETGIAAFLAEKNLILKSTSSTNYESPLPYAYHLDAIKLGQLLKKISIENGVICTSEKISEVLQHPNGDIKSVILSNGSEVKGDFFVDCTGFKGLLINKTLNVPYHSYQDELVCNAAVNFQTHRSDQKSAIIRSFTTATALEDGWSWEIDLPTRTGNGYVFNDNFISYDEAVERLAQSVGIDVNEVSPNKHSFVPGRRTEIWKNNCLSIGLASGFIEPLESTGLQFIEVVLRNFVDYFPMSNGNDSLRQSFNKVTNRLYDETKDFIVLHYALSRRNDTSFWKFVSNDMKISDTLENKLELWKSRFPKENDFDQRNLFFNFNYIYILAGMDYLPAEAARKQLNHKNSQSMIHRLAQMQINATQQTLKHEDYIKRLRAPFGL
jgi:tryptophan halogenase